MEAGELVVDAVGGVRVVTLHRPSKRNVLSRAMVADLLRVWRQFEASDDVKCVVLRGSGDFPCLCAGRRSRGARPSTPARGGGRSTPRTAPGALEFFEREYEMNAFLAAMRTPHVAIMDGIVMGGGCGVSIHGAFRVATERTVLSMPECAIGLVPDVGGTHFLARLPGETGTRLALTGARVGGADALATGLATHVVPSSDVPKLVDILDSSTRHAASADAARDAVAAALAATQRASASAVAALNLGPGASRRADDDEWFAGDTIDEIRDALARAAGEGTRARARVTRGDGRRVAVVAGHDVGVAQTLARLARGSTRMSPRGIASRRRVSVPRRFLRGGSREAGGQGKRRGTEVGTPGRSLERRARRGRRSGGCEILRRRRTRRRNLPEQTVTPRRRRRGRGHRRLFYTLHRERA